MVVLTILSASAIVDDIPFRLLATGSEESISKECNSSTCYIDKGLTDVQLIEQAIANLNVEDHTFHVFSHGRAGELLINGQWLDAQQLTLYFKEMLSQHIEHLNIYGCHFAEGEKGEQAIRLLERNLNVSIAASTNVTGKDGDWILEYGYNSNHVN